MRSRLISRRLWLSALSAAASGPRPVWIVPNFHPASCGWLVDFSTERVHCANSYFDHLNRVRDDPCYSFVLSEVNNLIAMANFRPERMAELRQRIREKRVELVNAFFLEPTVNLTGGEALVRLGLEGIRWQERMFGVRPRFGWMIDVCGVTGQMAQICAGLGLEAMVYTRMNPTGSVLHWAESPDGTRILAIAPGEYNELRPVFTTRGPLSERQLEGLEAFIASKERITPPTAPLLVLAGSGDYSLAPLYRAYPGELLRDWDTRERGTRLRFGTAGQYLDDLLPDISSAKLRLPVMRGGTAYPDYLAFWFQNPKVKTWFRRNEHALFAAEQMAALTSVAKKGYRYPTGDLYDAWLQLFLSMDRNTLWGAAAGDVFEHASAWDVRDRLTAVERTAERVTASAARALLPRGVQTVFYNALSWDRGDPFLLPDGSIGMAAIGAVSVQDVPKRQGTAEEQAIDRPDTIETSHYLARVDRRTGAIHSLILKPSNVEVLGGLANVLVAERPRQPLRRPADQCVNRPDRVALGSSTDLESRVTCRRGALATIVEAESPFLKGALCRRTMRFYHSHPRIDFETEVREIPDRTIVLVDFPLARRAAEVRRGTPYGFSTYHTGIVPVVRWSHYSFGTAGPGVAILDRGLTGRELTNQTAALLLMNALDSYRGLPNSWLSGSGIHRFSYALLAHEGGWKAGEIARRSWEFNTPPLPVEGRSVQSGPPVLMVSANAIVESVRRTGSVLELRLVECFGEAGQVKVRLNLPHRGAVSSSMTGGDPHALTLEGGTYVVQVAPQQIVTLRFVLESSIQEPPPVVSWERLAPPKKRAALRRYSDHKGHPGPR